MTSQEIKIRYQATTIAPWGASVEGHDQLLGGSNFIMTGIWQEKRGEDFEICEATIAIWTLWLMLGKIFLLWLLK